MAQAAATLREAAIKRRSLAVEALLVLGGAVFVALFAQIRIPLPFTPVPITGQTFAVLLVAATLGSIRGGASLALYVALGAGGVPVFTGWARGLDILKGATGGYLIGFVVAAIVVGLLAERGWDRKFRSAIGAMLTGNVIIYLFGLPWLSRVLGTGLDATLKAGLYFFVPGDLLKLYLAAALLPAAWKFAGRGTHSI